MSENAACPRCDSYVSQVYYEGCHEWCGWNCGVEYKVSASGPHGSVSLDVRTVKPTAEQRRKVAELVGATETSVSVAVDGWTPDHLSQWLDPEQPDPPPISEHKRKANIKALRDKRLDAARRGIEDEFADSPMP